MKLQLLQRKKKKKMKRNKVISVLVFFILFTSCHSQRDLYKNHITIKYVGFEVESPIRITCGNYEKYFKNSIDSVVITDDNVFSNIFKKLQTLNPIDSNFPNHADTRVKLYIYTNGKIMTVVCMDNFVVEYNDTIYQNDGSLKKMLSRFFTKN